jgi:hypothetical protein
MGCRRRRRGGELWVEVGGEREVPSGLSRRVEFRVYHGRCAARENARWRQGWRNVPQCALLISGCASADRTSRSSVAQRQSSVDVVEFSTIPEQQAEQTTKFGELDGCVLRVGFVVVLPAASRLRGHRRDD